jgi:hypothetical protein
MAFEVTYGPGPLGLRIGDGALVIRAVGASAAVPIGSKLTHVNGASLPPTATTPDDIVAIVGSASRPMVLRFVGPAPSQPPAAPVSPVPISIAQSHLRVPRTESAGPPGTSTPAPLGRAVAVLGEAAASALRRTREGLRDTIAAARPLSLGGGPPIEEIEGPAPGAAYAEKTAKALERVQAGYVA